MTCDVGGTFTDVVVSDPLGDVQIGKALTTPHDLLAGLRSALDRAASALGLDLAALLERTALFVYTTQATNAILQGTTARTALLCTDGFPDVLVRREGGSMYPYDFSRPNPPPYVPRHLTFEIRERIGAGGEVVETLCQSHIALVHRHLETGVREALELLFDRLEDLGMTVADVEHADAADEVEIFLAVDIPELGTQGTLGEDWVCIAHAADHFGRA